MTTGWLIVNFVLVAVVAAIVALPAVLIPHKLDRDVRTAVRTVRAPRTAAPSRNWSRGDRQRADAA
jgi:hypothetical protein